MFSCGTDPGPGDGTNGCVPGGAPLEGDSTVIRWNDNLCITNGVRVNLLKELTTQANLTLFLTKIGTTYYFQSSDEAHGGELWKSDGTQEGTEMVKDIKVGPENSNILLLTNVNGTLFFVATDVNANAELWKSDGTEAGTVMVKDIWPGDTGSSPEELTEMGEKLYFRALDLDNFWQLWVSDGTEEGTQILNKTPSPQNGPTFFPNHLVSTGETLFFQNPTQNSTRDIVAFEFWKTDGTEANTVLIKSIEHNENNVQALGNELVIDGVLYFIVQRDEENIRELWRSDGTDAGTQRLKEMSCNAMFINQFDLTEVDGLLYFKIHENMDGFSELWKSDGTPEGTEIVRTDPNWMGLFSQPMSLTAADGVLVFEGQGDKGSTGLEGTQQLWKSDGTEAGTQQLAADATDGSIFILGKLSNGTVIFEGDTSEDVTVDEFLWKTDGTEEGTVQITSL